MENEKKVRRMVICELPHFRLYAALSLLSALTLQLTGLLPPFLMERVIDRYIPARALRPAVASIGLFALIPTVTILGNTLYQYWLAVVGRRYGGELTARGFQALVCQPMSYFDTQNSGELASYCKSEAMGYILFWLFDIPQLAATLLCGGAALALLGTTHPAILLTALLYIPLMLLPSRALAGRMESCVKKIVEENARISQIIADTFRGIRFVKAFSLEGQRIAKLRAALDATVRDWSKIAMLDNLNGSWLNGFADNLTRGVVFALGAVLIIRGSMTLGTLLLAINLLPALFQSVRTAASSHYNFHQQSAKFDKLFSLITMEREAPGGNLTELPAEASGDEITFRQVSFRYQADRETVLRDVSFSVRPGEWLGIVGESGGGKSTLFALLTRLYEYDGGEIRLRGIPIRDIQPQALRRQITLISQSPFLFPGTIAENLRLAKPSAPDAELLEALERAGLSSLLAQLPEGIDTEIGEDGWQLSGGERQRLCLAMGLLRNSRILLLDEVTSSLDAANSAKLREVIQALHRERALTVLSISHNYEFLEDADRILELQDGRAVPWEAGRQRNRPAG